jgi:uncharacterized membrane protein
VDDITADSYAAHILAVLLQIFGFVFFIPGMYFIHLISHTLLPRIFFTADIT